VLNFVNMDVREGPKAGCGRAPRLNRAAQPKEPQNVPTVRPWSATAFGC
jgi:hypothetical protein